MHINGTSEKTSDNIYKWNVLSASGDRWLITVSLFAAVFIPKHLLLIRMCFLQIYILSVVKRYVFISCVFSVYFCCYCFFCSPLKPELKLLLPLCILLKIPTRGASKPR